MQYADESHSELFWQSGASGKSLLKKAAKKARRVRKNHALKKMRYIGNTLDLVKLKDFAKIQG